MKNVFAKAFTNLSSLFTPPGLRKRSRVEHPEADQCGSDGPARKLAKTQGQAAALQAHQLSELDVPRQSGHTASGLPLSRPAICPAESIPEPSNLLHQSSHQRQQRPKQQVQAQRAAQQQVKAQPQKTTQDHLQPQSVSWHAMPKNPSPLSKTTNDEGDDSTFGSNFTVEGSGLKLLADEPASCWQPAANVHAQPILGQSHSRVRMALAYLSHILLQTICPKNVMSWTCC